MKELQRKQRMKRLLYSVPSLICLSAITFFLAKGAGGVMLKERESAGVVSGLEAKALASEERQKELEASIERLKTEEGVMEEIKDKFSVTREGEHVAIIVDERRAATSTGVPERAWYKRFWAAIISLYESR